MATFNKDDFISKLPEGLREQASACHTAAELLELADKNDVELPQEALEAAAGGNCADFIPDKLGEGPG